MYRFSTLIFLFLFCVMPGTKKLFSQTEYYVDFTNGNDSNPGTQALPWKTIGKVNGESFSAGDHIKFKCGETWNEFLFPGNSGNSTQGYIVYESYGSGDKPVLAHTDYGIIIDGYQYLEFNGFEITSSMGVMIKDESGSSPAAYITITQCSIHGNSIPPAYTYGDGCVNVSLGSHHITVSNNIMYNHYYPVWFGDGAGCSSTISDNTIYDCSGNGIGLDEISCSDSTQIVISGNTIYNADWHGMEISANYILIENNIVYNSGTSGHSGIHLFARYDVTEPDKGGDFNIIRNNVCYNIHDHDATGLRTDGNGIQADQWCDSNDIYNNISYNNDGAGIILFGSSGNNVYNNTLYNNGLDLGNRYGRYEFVICQDDDSPCINNLIKNNIGLTAKQGHFAAAIDEVSVDSNNLFFNNIWYNTQAGGDVGIIDFDTHSTDSVAFSVWENYSWTFNEISQNPLFADSASKDFHLLFGSPAINSGVTVPFNSDNENNPRPLELICDRGAFEYGKYWTGQLSSQWDSVANWNDSIVPVDTSVVTIPFPQYYQFMPEVNDSVTLKKLYLSDSAKIKVNTGASLQISD
jgi:parallel beta-helix repeat protein